MRKNLLEYDDVANDQRKVVYEQRNELMESDSVRDTVDDLREEIVPNVVARFVPPGSMEEAWDLEGLEQELQRMTNTTFDVRGWLAEEPDLPEEDIGTRVVERLVEDYAAKEAAAGEEGLRRFEKYVMLQALDEHWKEHLAGMDYLRQSINLRGYAQKNPKQEYKKEAFGLFTNMLDEYKGDVVTVLKQGAGQEPRAGRPGRAARRPAAADPGQLRAPRGGERAVGRRRGGDRRARGARPRRWRHGRRRTPGERRRRRRRRPACRGRRPARARARPPPPRSPTAARRRSSGATTPASATRGRSTRTATGS